MKALPLNCYLHYSNVSDKWFHDFNNKINNSLDWYWFHHCTLLSVSMSVGSHQVGCLCPWVLCLFWLLLLHFFFHQCRLSSLDTATPLLNRWSFSKVLWRSPGVEGNSRSHFEVPALQHKTLDYIVPVHLCHSYVLNRTHACDTCWHDPLHLWLPCAARVCVVACPWLVPVDLDPDWSGTWSDPPICLIQLEEQHSLSWNRPTVVAAWFLCGAHRCVILKNWL